MIVDVASFVGPYPFRDVGDVSIDSLLVAMDRAGIERAWVGHLASFLHRDPAPANEVLYAGVREHQRLSAAPTIDPDLPAWRDDLLRAVDSGAAAIRIYPMHQGLSQGADVLADLTGAAGEHGLPVILTVRFEDVRQRHPLDLAGDLPAATVRHLARLNPRTRIVVTHGSREYVEEIHFGLTPDEAQRVFYDVSWLWGPPADDLDVLASTVGADRFVWGSAYPLRIPEAPAAKLDLSNLDRDQRARIESGNVLGLLSACTAARVS